MIKYKETFNSYKNEGIGVNEIAPDVCLLTFTSGEQKTIKNRRYIKAIQKDFAQNLPKTILFFNSLTKKVAHKFELK